MRAVRQLAVPARRASLGAPPSRRPALAPHPRKPRRVAGRPAGRAAATRTRPLGRRAARPARTAGRRRPGRPWRARGLVPRTPGRERGAASRARGRRDRQPFGLPPGLPPGGPHAPDGGDAGEPGVPGRRRPAAARNRGAPRQAAALGAVQFHALPGPHALGPGPARHHRAGRGPALQPEQRGRRGLPGDDPARDRGRAGPLPHARLSRAEPRRGRVPGRARALGPHHQRRHGGQHRGALGGAEPAVRRRGASRRNPRGARPGARARPRGAALGRLAWRG